MSPSPQAASLTLRTVVLASLVSGAAAGGGAFLVTRAVAPGVPPAAADPAAPPAEATDRPEIAAAPSATDADAPAALETLREALETAEAERSQLAGTVLALSRRAEALETRLGALADVGHGTGSEESGVEDFLPGGETGEGIVAGEGGGGLGGEGDPANGEASDSLVAAGLDPASAADIRRRRDEFSLARLELIDRATREGWADSDRFGESLEALEEQRPNLREELGDEAYDRYLFEEGGRNRVAIASVISGSAASEAGLAPGDIVLSYAGERVFRSRELQAATRAGERGEYVQLSVLRDGEIVAVDVPRGPLGVGLDGLRRPPG